MSFLTYTLLYTYIYIITQDLDVKTNLSNLSDKNKPLANSLKKTTSLRLVAITCLFTVDMYKCMYFGLSLLERSSPDSERNMEDSFTVRSDYYLSLEITAIVLFMVSFKPEAVKFQIEGATDADSSRYCFTNSWGKYIKYASLDQVFAISRGIPFNSFSKFSPCVRLT